MSIKQLVKCTYLRSVLVKYDLDGIVNSTSLVKIPLMVALAAFSTLIAGNLCAVYNIVIILK